MPPAVFVGHLGAADARPSGPRPVHASVARVRVERQRDPGPGVMHDSSPAERVAPEAPRLLPRIAQGDETAVAACVAEYGGLLWSLARRWATDPADAEDAVQEIFFDLWKSADRFDAARATERSFVVMIARRRLIDRVRKRTRQLHTMAWPEEFDVADPASLPDARAGAAVDAATLLEGLSPVQRQLLERHLLDGRTHEEIARESALPLGTVKSHIRRGLLRARALLAGRTPDSEEQS